MNNNVTKMCNVTNIGTKAGDVYKKEHDSLTAWSIALN